MFVALTGASALVFNTQMWHLYLMNAFLGAGMGIYFPSIQSIMFDNFDEKNRRLLSGMQSAFNNGGGIFMSFAAGLLITFVWYGGHLVTLLALPVAVISFFTIPGEKKTHGLTEKNVTNSRIPGSVYYHACLIFVFMVVFNVAGMNISTHIKNGNIGDSAVAGGAMALMMAGGVVSGLVFPKVSKVMRDYIFPFAFILLFIGYSLMNFFPSSLVMTFAAMAICGMALCLYMPRCIFNASNLTDPSNSATATMLIACIAPGGGSFLSPLIMTNLTMLIGGDSTQFRYQFTACICLALAVLMFIKIRLESKHFR
jgi:MFS family permease